MFEDDETLQMYIEESLDHLGDIESDLLTIEEGGANIDLDLVNNVFRAAHSVKGGAGFMGLTTIKDLSHHLENVLGLIRTNELTPDSARISVLLKGFDKLETLLISFSCPIVGGLKRPKVNAIDLPLASFILDNDFSSEGVILPSSMISFNFLKNLR